MKKEQSLEERPSDSAGTDDEEQEEAEEAEKAVGDEAADPEAEPEAEEDGGQGDQPQKHGGEDRISEREPEEQSLRDDAGGEYEIEKAASPVHRPIVGQHPEGHRRAAHAAQAEQEAAGTEGEPFPGGVQPGLGLNVRRQLEDDDANDDEADDLVGQVFVFFADQVQHPNSERKEGEANERGPERGRVIDLGAKLPNGDDILNGRGDQADGDGIGKRDAREHQEGNAKEAGGKTDGTLHDAAGEEN